MPVKLTQVWLRRHAPSKDLRSFSSRQCYFLICWNSITGSTGGYVIGTWTVYENRALFCHAALLLFTLVTEIYEVWSFSHLFTPPPPMGTQAWSPLGGTGWRDGWGLFYESLRNLVHAVGNSSHNIVSETSPGSNAASSCSCSCRGSLYSWGQCCSFMKCNFKQWFLCVFWLLIMFRLKNNDQQTTIRKILNEL